MVQDVMNAHLDESEIAGVETLSTEIAGVETLSTEIAGVETLSPEIAGVETLSTEEKTNDAAAAGTVMDNTVDTAPLDDILDAETGADQKQGL